MLNHTLVFLKQLRETAISIAPVFALVLVLNIFTGFMTLELLARWALGAFFAAIGLFLFLRGVDFCLTPLGEIVGSRLLLSPKIVILAIVAFCVGGLVCAADPSVIVLVEHLNTIHADYASQGPSTFNILLAVLIGVGFFLALGLLRVLKGIRIQIIMAICYGGMLVIGIVAPQNLVPLAFDSGGISTGPLVVPFLLALNISFVGMLGSRYSSSDGFGLVGLITLGPIIGVMVLGILWS